MKHEYPGYNGFEKWLLVSSLSEAEVLEQFADEVQPYTPFIYMSRETFSPIAESQNNQRKHEIRAAKLRDAFAYDDGITETHHPELLYDPFSTHASWLFLYETLEQLTPTQRERIRNRYFLGMTMVDIAKLEGVSTQAVEKSIKQSLQKLRVLWDS